MKISACVLALLALSSTSMALSKPAPTMEPGCETAIRASAAILENGYVGSNEQTGDVTVAGADIAAVQISNVQILASSCHGPAECDKQNPDSFTYAANIGQKGQGLAGKVVVSYHRGNCFVKKISLDQ